MISIRPAMSVIADDHAGVEHEAELGGEARRAHHPQRVVGERVLGSPGRPQQSLGEIDHSPERVHELA